jgi:lipopolysaccharide export system permease protein
MIVGTLGRYFGMRFLSAVLGVFWGVFSLIILIDYVENMRRIGNVPGAGPLTAAQLSLLRVPNFIEQLLPFCVLVAGIACFLNLSRRLELAIARGAGISAWQFTAPALLITFLIGVGATTVYNPLAAGLQEYAKRKEAEVFGNSRTGLQLTGGAGFWMRQRGNDGQSIMNAMTSHEQGAQLGNVTAFTYDAEGRFKERIEAKSATHEPGFWRLRDVRVYAIGKPPLDRDSYMLSTHLTTEQVRESFSTPDTLSFWQLPLYIQIAERAGLPATGYQLQYQKLLARPFLLVAMFLIAASVSLRFFRFGGVQKMVLSGMAAGFLLYVLQKMTDDLTKAELMSPIAAAWLPAWVGAVIGLVALLYQEDG